MECVNCGNETGSRSKYCSTACKSQYFRNQRKSEEENKQHSRIVRAIDGNDIIDRFLHGELGEQDAVNQFQSQWELANPQPKEGYREWSAKRAKEVDAFRERLIRSKPISRVSQSQTQPTQPRELTVTNVAELRAMELRGEIPMQFQSYQTPLYDSTPHQPEQPAIQAVTQSKPISYLQQQSQQPAIRAVSQNIQPVSQFQPALKNLIANLANGVKEFFSRFNPKFHKQEIPERPVNEYGIPLSYEQCVTCGGAWLNTGEVAIHLAEGHVVKYIPT